MKKRKNNNKFDFNKFAKRFSILSLVYILFMIVVWNVVARQFPSGVEPKWLLWLIISLSILGYVGLIFIVEFSHYRRRRIK